MDILHLVDRLEELFNESRPIWLTHSVIVDEDRMLDLIDQMRVAIPEEIKKAQQVISQRDGFQRRQRKKPTGPLPWPGKKLKNALRTTKSSNPQRSGLNKSLIRRIKTPPPPNAKQTSISLNLSPILRSPWTACNHRLGMGSTPFSGKFILLKKVKIGPNKTTI